MEIVDLLVIGAGVVGLSFARRASRQGASVALVDSSNPGGRGSRAAAGVAIPSVGLWASDDVMSFARTGQAALEEDAAELEHHVGNLRHGSGIIRIAGDDKTRAMLESARAEDPSWVGRWATADEIAALEPMLAGSRAQGGFVSEKGFTIDAPAYLDAMLRDARQTGVDLKLGVAVVGIEEQEHRVLVTTTDGDIACDRFLVAAGAWSGTLPGLSPLPIRPRRGQMIELQGAPHPLERVISSVNAYLAPGRGSDIVVGATEEKAGFACHATPAGLLYLSAAVARTAPRASHLPVRRLRVGLRSSGPDARPLLGRYPGTRRGWLASAHGGMGILTGAFSGASLARILAGQPAPEIEPFDPQRVLSNPR